MSPKIERAIYIGIIAVLALLVLSFGKKQVELQKNLPLTVEQLYKKLGNPRINLQVIDVRPYQPSEEEEDDAEDYQFYTLEHIPGSIPMPDCDLSKTPEDAKDHINFYLPTVIVSEDGNPEIFKKCAQKFKIVQNVKGGMKAWLDAGYPTEEDEYVPPKAGGGGGCL
ncbi:rhodanese-like domain-containing protein [Hydrogenivirga sp. 128-5-R1-1]|uniref:rhodanese-like domain-containing protein n=1 Tax=Hydrogenivirga sp. 128-5-R1-1 TaxID=392423 RepID=UPI00030C6E33|nr:rhodanese-like domain-containing protein [Hydrogenivirga sp. 128-5-R1-1]